MRKPDFPEDPAYIDGIVRPEPVEIIAAATPVFIAQAVVGVAMILGATIIIQGRTLWAVVIGWAQ